MYAHNVMEVDFFGAVFPLLSFPTAVALEFLGCFEPGMAIAPAQWQVFIFLISNVLLVFDGEYGQINLLFDLRFGCWLEMRSWLEKLEIAGFFALFPVIFARNGWIFTVCESALWCCCRCCDFYTLLLANIKNWQLHLIIRVYGRSPHWRRFAGMAASSVGLGLQGSGGAAR